MANLKRRLARLEALRAAEPPPPEPITFEEVLSWSPLLRSNAARHGVEFIVTDSASFIGALTGMSDEEAAARLRDALSDVVFIGEGADGAKA